MAKRAIKAGSADQTIDIFVLDSSSTIGAGLSGLAYNTSGLKCYYRKGATGSVTALTLATQTVGGAHSDGGFVELDATNMKGTYRLDLSDTIVASAGMVTVYLYGATNMAPVVLEVEVVSFDPFDAVRLGLTALPNAAAEASGGLPTLSAAQASNGTIQANVHRWLTGTPNALQSGRVDSYLGALASGVIAAASFAANALDAVWSTATRVLTAGTNIVLAKGTGVTGFNDLDAAGVRSAVGLGSANLDTQLTAIDDYIDTEVAAIKAKTDNLPSDPADASDIAGAFGTVNTTLATIAGYIDTEVAAIKAKTDNLPASPAATGDAMTLTSGERTAIANEVEAQIIDDTDSEKVLQAIVDKIAAANPSLDDLTLSAIASAVRTELTTELARIDATISSRSTYAGGDTAGTTTLLARLTATRAGLMDNLTNLDAAVSSRSTYAGGDTAGTTTLLGRLTALRAAALDNLDAAISAVKSKTDNLPSDPADASDIAASFGSVTTALATIAGYLDTEIAAIKTKTDNLPSDPADQSAVEAAISALDVPTVVEIAEALLDTSLGAGTDDETRSVRNALRFLRNKWSIAGGVLTVTEEDDVTPAWTAAVTQTAGDPVSAVDPV